MNKKAYIKPAVRVVPMSAAVLQAGSNLNLHSGSGKQVQGEILVW